MKITYLVDSSKNLQVTDAQIVDFAQNLSLYSGVYLKGTINGGTPLEQIITTTSVISTAGAFYLQDSILYVTPIFFGIASFVDSIVKLEVRLIKSIGGYYAIQNCIFVDVTFKCRVASLLQNIVEENENRQDKEKISSFIHLMHYGLTNGSNCGCNCSELVDLFVELGIQLTNVDPNTTNPCGCE